MRIIAGTLRGRVLSVPANAVTRPTADRVRQALFDMLGHAPWRGNALDGGVVDAFAGTGALGLEALSRGAARAVFLERDRAALACVRANIATCRMAPRALALGGDALRPPATRPGWNGAGLVFLDVDGVEDKEDDVGRGGAGRPGGRGGRGRGAGADIPALAGGASARGGAAVRLAPGSERRLKPGRRACRPWDARVGEAVTRRSGRPAVPRLRRPEDRA